MNKVILRVKGERACFTDNTVSKQNRYSYPFCTGGAARGILASVFLKPEFDWVVNRIAVVKAGRSDVMAVNEVKFGNMKKPIDAIKNRIQIWQKILRDVEYIIEAEPLIVDAGDPKNPNTKQKYVAQFNRRMDGKKEFYRTPCLGLRECVARVEKIDEFPERGCEMPDMVFDNFFVGVSYADQRNDGEATHYCYKRVEMENGIITLPWFSGYKYKVGA